MVAFLTKETGWTIRYIMDLSLKQVKLLFAGYKDIGKIQSKNIDDSKDKRTNVNKKGKQDDIEILKSMMMSSNFNITDRAKKRFQKILEKKQKESKENA